MPKLLIGITAVLMVAMLLLPGVALAQPDQCDFWGTATLDGEVVSAGTEVVASIDGQAVANSTVIDTATFGPVYNVSIVQPSGEDYAGKVVSFEISGYAAGETGTWEAGKNKRLDISTAPGLGPAPGVIDVIVNWSDGDSTLVGDVLTLYLGEQPVGPQGPAGTAGAPGAPGDPGEDAPGGIAIPIVALVIAIIAAGVAVMSTRRRV